MPITIRSTSPQQVPSPPSPAAPVPSPTAASGPPPVALPLAAQQAAARPGNRAPGWLSAANVGASASPLAQSTESVLTAMLQKAPAAKKEVDDLAFALASAHGGSVATAPIKSKARALQKINQDYGGDAIRIKDLARNTIVVAPHMIAAVAQELGRQGANVKQINAGDNALGYSGVNTTFKTKSGIVGEIQVNSPAMIYAKEQPEMARALLGSQVYASVAEKSGVEGGLGHHYYEQWRVKAPDSPEAESIAATSRAYYDTIRSANEH